MVKKLLGAKDVAALSDWYDRAYTQMANEGMRVIALAYVKFDKSQKIVRWLDARIIM